jgi:hypothetical protein
MSNRPVFRVIDGEGQVDDDTAVVPADYGLLLEANRKHLREIAGLKGQISRMTKVDPLAETIEAALIYWKLRCHGPNSRVQIPLDGARAAVVKKTLARLVEADDDPPLASTDKAERAVALESATDRALDRIKQAVDGAARKPFEGAYGKRFPEQLPGTRRKVDLVYILRDEVKMEQFVSIVETDELRQAYRAELYRQLTTRPGMLALFASLQPEHSEIICASIRWAQTQATL